MIAGSSPPNPHPVDHYLKRAIDTEADFQAHRHRVFDALEQLTQSFANNLNAPPPLTVASELSDGLTIYLYAHDQAGGLSNGVPEHLRKRAERARKHVGNGGEFCLDHALGLIDPPFRGPKPKGPGEHKHRRLFLMTFYDSEVAEANTTQIAALQNAAEHAGLNSYEEKYLEGEYRKWRDKNNEWIIWFFDLI